MTIENRKLYAYLNINNPMVAWEVAIGRVQSICDSNRFGVSVWFYNLVKGFIDRNDHLKISNELKLELVRMKMFSHKVSRLQGLYFFESQELAEIAVDRWGIPDCKQYVTEVYFSGSNYTEVDSEWITTYLREDPSLNPEWMEGYWRGDTLGVKPLTEILASGVGLVHDKKIREMAYKKIIESWPTTSILLNACMGGFAKKGLENIGRGTPTITVDEGNIVGKYYIELDEFQKNQKVVVQAMVEMEQEGCNLPNILPNDNESIFSLPDFRHMGFTANDDVISGLLTEIHAH